MEPPRDTHRISTSTDKQSGRVRSLFKSSALQRSTLTADKARTRGSEFSSVHYADEESRADKDKDKKMGGRLLDMLRKTLQESESEELVEAHETPTLVPFGDVVGCLAVHVKKCRQFSNKISLQHCIDLFIRISINNIVKCTKTHSLISSNNERKPVIKFDEVKYFSIQVPRRQEDKRNNIFLELMQYGDTEKHPLLLGSIEVHLYEVIQFICRLEVEFMFSYGNFGYGFSHQLKPLQKIVEPSMFMNVAPPPERTDPQTNVITPQPVEYPAFLSPDLNVTVGTSSDVRQPSVRLEKLQQQPRQRLEKMKKEYRNLNTWKEKVDYLESIINPKLNRKDSKGSNMSEALESQNNQLYEDHPDESITTFDIPVINKEAETTSSEVLDNDDQKDLTIPTLIVSDQDNPTAVAPESEESTPPPTDIPLLAIPALEITDSDKRPSSDEHQSEAMPEEKKNDIFLSEVKLNGRYPSLLKTEPSLTEMSPIRENGNFPYFSGMVIHDELLGHKNTNKKGKSVDFSQKEYTLPSFIPEYIEFKSKYQKFDDFDPFLRNINAKMSVRKRKDQDIYKCRKILISEVIEHEDQDPPYPAHIKTAGSTNITWTPDPNVITIQMSNMKNKQSPDPTINTIKTSDIENKLSHDPTITNTTKTSSTKNKLARDLTINTTKTSDNKNKLASEPYTITMKTSDTKNKLKERLPNVSLPNFKRDSSMTGNVNIYHPSKSLSLTSDIENLKQSMALKSILSKNLQDLSDKLFSKPEVYMNTDTIKKSHSPLVNTQKPTESMEHKVSEKVQDLNSWISAKDILNSHTLLSQISKNNLADLLGEGKPGKSPEVEEGVSEKHLKSDETDFPMKKKSSFKKRHLTSEVSSSKSGLNSSADEYFIKQIFTAPVFSQLGIGVKELSEAQVNLQDQWSTPWERNLSSNIVVNYGEKDEEIRLSRPKSVISQIIQAFPVDDLLENGIIKVIELGKEHQSSLLATKISSSEEEPKDSTEDYSNIKSKTELLSGQNIPIISPQTTSSIGRVEFIKGDQSMSRQDSKYHSIPAKKPDLPSQGQRLDREENDLSSTLESLSNSLVDKLKESNALTLESFFKNIFKDFLKYHQSERRRQPEKELERHSLPSSTDHFEEIQENFNKADKLDRKPILSPKLCVFLEELSESEIKNLKAELSKHIQHYLVERLSDSGHITKEDLPKIYKNLCLMNEKAELKEQNISQEKYSETVKEIMSFVNNFNHHFIDKHLEIKLRSFLNEILQNYFLKNLSESSLFNETESANIHSSISSVRTRSALLSFHELGQDISKGSFGQRLEINMKYHLNKSLQNYLRALSENELLNLKADLSKYIQSLFIEKLSKSGLISQRQLKGINENINLLNSSSIPLKYIKTDLPFRDESYFLEVHSEKQNKYSKIGENTTLQKIAEDKHIETELMRKGEKGYPSLHGLKENTPTVREHKNYYPTEVKTLSLIKVQPSSNRNIQVIPLNKSSERLTDILLKKHKKEHGVMQLPQAENFVYKTEFQDPCSWDGKSKIIQSKPCFERTLKVKTVGKKENINIYELTVQEKAEAVLSSYPKIPHCRMPREDEEYLNRPTFPTWQTNTSIHFDPESEEQSKLDQYYQRLKGNNNNNKKHLVTFAEAKNEIQTRYINPNETCNEKCMNFPESRLKNSKPSFFPEVLKRENVKPKVQKERDHVTKPKKSFNKIIRILPATLPTTRTHLRKSVPSTLLHWTARTTIHDCLDKLEDLHVPSVKHPKKTKPRARLLGKSPDGSHNQAKHSARPYTAPEPNKQRESATRKFASPQMFSSGLVHINATTPDYEMHKMRPKKKLTEDIEKRSLICDIIQTLNISE